MAGGFLPGPGCRDDVAGTAALCAHCRDAAGQRQPVSSLWIVKKGFLEEAATELPHWTPSSDTWEKGI